MPAKKRTVMIRSRDAGVFYGTLQPDATAEDQGIVVLTDARRVWYWKGAATLSELATKGPKYPKQCKFPAPTAGPHTILGVCEVIPVTNQALEALDAVPVWTEH